MIKTYSCIPIINKIYIYPNETAEITVSVSLFMKHIVIKQFDNYYVIINNINQIFILTKEYLRDEHNVMYMGKLSLPEAIRFVKLKAFL